MKKLLLACAFVLIGFSTSLAQEFKLHVLVQANGLSRNLYFGYDPNASDSMSDTQWGELLLPPGGAPGEFDARMTNRTLGRKYLTFFDSTTFDGGATDIRRKPAIDSFQLQYELYNNAVDVGVPVSFFWDNSNIPPSIKHIYLAPEGNPDIKVRLDMKTETQFDVSAQLDSSSLYSVMLITLVFNSGSKAVRQINSPTDVITIFPNPMDSKSSMQFTMSEESRLTLSAYDITGRKIFERMVNANAGENTIELDKRDFSAHSGIFLLRLRGMENDRPFEKTSSIILQ